ncbi:MAG: putative ABC transporter permease [Oscillospiraceae bacterium]|nr:putative ABC transporter permease [Oscillospiraceae bacterium]
MIDKKKNNSPLLSLLVLFVLGGIIYAGIEVLVREFTHISMFIVGGLCFLLIGSIKYWKNPPIPVTVQMLISCAIITVLELISGLIVNVWLGLNVWDYSDQRYNLFGQICLHASSIWVFLSFFAIYAHDFASRRMFGMRRIYMRILP